MKKTLIALLAVLMLSACTSTKQEEVVEPQQQEIIDQPVEEDVVVGGWTINTNLPEMNDAIFDQARQDIDGASYSPLFQIGIQPAAGQNRMYLAYVTPVVSDAKPSLKVVTVFEDLENNHKSEITNVAEFNISDYLDRQGSTTPEGLMGGWQDASELPNMLTDEENEVFEKALDGLVGVSYTPVAKLASQVVAGTNYAFLSLGTSVTAQPITHLYVINVYADLQGNAILNNICGIDLSMFNAK